MEERINKDIIKAEGIEKSVVSSPSTPSDVNQQMIRLFTDNSTFEVSVRVPGTLAADDANYGVFYVASAPCFLIEARIRYSVVSSAGGTVLRLDKVLDGGAPGAIKASMTNATFDLTATANVVQRQTGTIVLAGVSLDPGDGIAIWPSVDPTNLQNLVVTCLFGINNKNIPTGPAVS